MGTEDHHHSNNNNHPSAPQHLTPEWEAMMIDNSKAIRPKVVSSVCLREDQHLEVRQRDS
jgi:hypothetical protein